MDFGIPCRLYARRCAVAAAAAARKRREERSDKVRTVAEYRERKREGEINVDKEQARWFFRE